MESVGQKLKETRIKLNLSIDEVSERTKIRPHILAALEDNNFTLLQPVYMKSFIKTYSTFLKISQDEIQEFINEIFKEEKKSNEIEIEYQKPEQERKKAVSDFKKFYSKKNYFKNLNQQKMINYLIYSGLIIASILIVYIAVFYDGSSESGLNIQTGEERNSDTVEITKENKNLLSLFEKPDSLILEAQATDTAWLKIDVDGRANETVLLLPGSYKRWSSEKYFNLTVGNVGAIKFTRNGKLLEPLGSKGSVVRNVRITADKIEISSSPWDEPVQKKKETKNTQRKEVPRIEPSNIQTTPSLKKSTDTHLRRQPN